MAVKVLPFVSWRTRGEFVAGDHCSGPFRVHSVALSATPLAPATDDHVLLLPELPLCWHMLGWALLPKFPCDHVRFCSPLTLAFPTLLPGEGYAGG